METSREAPREQHETGSRLEADGWGNAMAEAYTGKPAGHRTERTRLKVDTAP